MKMMFFFMLLIISSLMIFMTSFWMIMWIYLELNLISFIYLMIYHNNNYSMESSLIYFIIQTIASIILMFGIMVSIFINNLLFLIIFSLMLKLGMAPLHFWLSIMIENINWLMIYLLLTWQKLAPMMIFYQYMYYIDMKMMIIFLMLSMMLSSLMGLNYSSLKKIMTYSSINQLTWLMVMLLLIKKMFKLYFIMYMYMMLMIIYSFYLFNMKYIYMICMMNTKNIKYKLFIFCNLLSLGGLPPFLGFFPKMMIIFKLNNSIIMMMMIMFTMIPLFFYIRIIMSLILLNYLQMNVMNIKFYNKLNMMMMMSIINNSLLLVMMFLF